MWLEPLRVDHAEEMAPLLDDVRLHTFIGGEPASMTELRLRYGRLVIGHSDEGAAWLNWVVRRRSDRLPLGTVQATVTRKGQILTAEVAWIIASAYQGRHYGREAAGVMVAWLRAQGASIVAHIHPENRASAAVARTIGLVPTSVHLNGEVRWQEAEPAFDGCGENP